MLGNQNKHLLLLTWPAVLCALLVDLLFDSASEQHPGRVMFESLERLTGAVGLLSGYAAGSLLPASRGGGVSAFPILVSLAESLSVSLALGQRAERPLLPHPFHAACMLGIQLPPLHHHAILGVSPLDYFSLFPSFSSSPGCIAVPPKSPPPHF